MTAPTNPGSYAVLATATGPNHAGSASGTLVIAKGPATVTLSGLTQTFSNAPKSVTASTAPAGLTVNLTYNGSPAPPTNAGSHPVLATIDDPLRTGSKSGTLVIAKAAQTIAFPTLTARQVGDAPFDLTASASSGLSVTYTSSNPAVATISGQTVTVVGKGTATITANQSGDANRLAAPKVTQTLTVAQAPSIANSPANKTVSAGQTAGFTVSVSGSSPFTFQWQRAPSGSETFATLTNAAGITGATTATLSVVTTSFAMSGDRFRAIVTNAVGTASSSAATLTVNKAVATVKLSGLAQTFNNSSRSATVTTTPAGLAVAVTYNGESTPPTNPGSYAVIATVIAPNHIGSADGTLVISRATVAITLSSLTQTFNGAPRAVTVATAPASLSVSVTYNGSETPPTNAGSYTIAATVSSETHTGSKSGTLVIAKAAQTITFPAPAPASLGDSPATLAATASSQLPVTYTSSNPSVATVNGAVLTYVGLGTTSITAAQPGDSNRLAAPNVVRTVTVKAPPPPTNDKFANRILLVGESVTTTGANFTATKETGEPNHASNAGGKSVWWSWTAPFSGVVTVSTAGSSFDTTLAGYTGATLASLTRLASNDDDFLSEVSTSLIQFEATAGTTYQLAVDGFNAKSGLITLAITKPVIPASPVARAASDIDFDGFTVGWNPVSGATGYLVDISRSADFSTFEPGYQNVDVGGILGGRATGLTGSTTYFYRVRAYNGAGVSASSAPISAVTTAAPPAPGNDMFVNRLPLTGNSVSTTGENSGATPETGEPEHGDFPAIKSLWWTWTAPAAGVVIISTAGSDFDTTLGIYTGNSVSALTTIAGNDQDGFNDTSRVVFQTEAGITYQIAVDGFFGDRGNIALSLLLSTTISTTNDMFANRIPLTGTFVTTAGNNQNATSETKEPRHAGFTARKSLWWSWTAPTAGVVSLTTAGSDFDTTLGVYTGNSVSALTTIASDDESGPGSTSALTFPPPPAPAIGLRWTASPAKAASSSFHSAWPRPCPPSRTG